MIDFAGKRWWYLSISLVFFIAAVTLLGVYRLRAGIEFTSGSSFTVEFLQREVPQDELRQAIRDMGHKEARVQGAGSNTYIVRTEELEGAPPLDSTADAGPQPVQQGEIDTIMAGLCERFRTDESVNCNDQTAQATVLTRRDFSTVSGTVSSEIARNATFAVIAASIAILIYISLAFRKLPRAYRYGTTAVVAVLHDAFIILGLFAFLGHWRGTEVDTAFITALLTIIGFSVHDTIVVFDRIRERMVHDPYIPFEEAVNASMTETLARSLNTSLVVVLTVVAMLLIGGVTIRSFLLVLLVGMVSGTYSSIAIASQLLVAWERNDIGRFWRRLRGKPEEPVAEPA